MLEVCVTCVPVVARMRARIALLCAAASLRPASSSLYTAGSMVRELDEVPSGETFALVEFYSEWCGH